MGLTDFKNTSDLADHYEESHFFPEYGFQNYMDYIEYKVNLINSFYETSLNKGQKMI